MTAIPGCDWAWGQPSDAALDAAGIRFACRYLSRADLAKVIRYPEAARHKAAGRGIVLVYEDDARRMLGGRAAGLADAAAAGAQAAAAGLAGAPVYFACDFDAAPAHQPAISAYLGGAAAVLGAPRVGAYGGYWPLSRIRAAGAAAWLWGTRAWSGDNWDTCGWRPHIMQGQQAVIGGVACDRDTAWAEDYGQWKPPGDWTEEAIMALPVLAEGARDQPGAMRLVHRIQNGVAGIGRWNGLGPVTALADDGVWGPATTAGVKRIQQFFGLDDDGVVGPDTWRKLIGA